MIYELKTMVWVWEKWSWGASNSRPDKAPESFLHV